MKVLINRLYKRNILHSQLVLAIGFALSLLAFRIYVTHSFFYSFLVWNLFLAAVPYLITQGFKNLLWALRGRWKVLVFGLWLLFLPNSPYIITDLVHLHNERSVLLWYDLFLVFVFALTGLVLGLLSMLDIYKVLAVRFSSRMAEVALFPICLLCGFGIYMGRFLRFNSWDVFSKPLTLFSEITASIQEPKAWFMTLGFGGFIWVLFVLVRSLALRK
ncbi:DUF1361 domain-containing protein [Poritiphilus flavus]|uniref:DUF1361 domain-containing protein n=1 Tax=Poritiphilus flavus TaxID=2697053 RepID=A0A6L9E8L1_9FLAO|nr:DUF1361 domain-containing protein [Poritiphilus flavus]NAS11050.1 DUF1361 domain-containing protein [Poritiphilus flavus]